MQRSDILRFVAKTLAAVQKSSISTTVDEALDMLIQLNIIQNHRGHLLASATGRAAALMYVDPIDLWYLRRALKQKPMTPTIIAQAFASMPSFAIPTYVPDDLIDPIEMDYGYQTLLATGLRDWLAGKPQQPSTAFIVNPFIADVARWTSALAISGIPKSYLKSLELMLINGVPETLTELVTLSGIGRKRALDLYNHGITKRSDITKNERLSRNILGAKTYEKVKMQLDAKKGKITFVF